MKELEIIITDGIATDDLNKIKIENKKIEEIIKSCNALNINEHHITKCDLINIKAFSCIYNMELKKQDNNFILKQKNGDIWKIEKSFQYKPFVKSNIYYRYYFPVEKKTIIDGQKTTIKINNYKEIMIGTGEQLAYDNKIQKYYFNHSEIGKCYFNYNVLVRNSNINSYAIIAVNIFNNKTINISHFIEDMINYNSYNFRKNTLSYVQLYNKNIDVQIYNYFQNIINKLNINK